MSVPKQKQTRQLSYSLPDRLLSPVTQWTTLVTKFYSDTLQMNDPTLYQALVSDVHIAKMTKDSESNKRDSEALAEPDLSRLSSPGGPPQTPSAAGDGRRGSVLPAYLSDSTQQIPVSDIPDALESLAVHFVVQLTSLLGHPSNIIRLSSVSLVFQLASILEKNVASQSLDALLVSFETDDHGYYDPVHELFKVTGKSFSIMAIAFVAGLECFNTSNDWRVRGICNAALARLVFENDLIFVQEDHLAAIWNLYFSLQSIPLISKVFPDRLVILKALHLLAPLYSTEDVSLSLSVADVLLRLKDKTPSEIATIRNVLKVIFESLSSHRAGNSGSNKSLDKESGQLVSRPPVGTLSDDEDGYCLFLNMITPHDEYAYDILAWAYEEFIMNTYASNHKGKRNIPIRTFAELNDFILSLTNHFRASPSLVRYGSAIVLHTTLQLCPLFMNDNRQIWFYLIAGAFDTDYLTAFLYMSMLEKLDITHAAEVRKMVGQLLGSEAIPALSESDETSKLMPKKKSKKVSRVDVLELVVKDSPAIAPIILHKMANAIEYLPLAAKLRQLQLIRVWAQKVERADSFLLQLIVPLCHSLDERVQLEAIKILQALIPSLTGASPTDLGFVWSNLVVVATSSCASKALLVVLAVMKQFPIQSLSEATSREEYLNCLFKNIFHPDPQIRYTVYSIIGSSGEFWKNAGMLNSALAVLMLCIGDDLPANARHVMDQIPQLGTPMLAQIFVPLSSLREAAGKSPTELVKAYDGLVTTFVTHKADYRSLVETVGDYERVDQFWNYFLHDVPDNQLAKPEDYSFGRNFVQNPYWISLFLSKLGIPPPLLGIEAKATREVMPATTAGKRRFICGFLHCLLPSLGMSDPALRYAACLAAVRCCFRGNTAHAGMLRSVLEYVTQYLLANKSWTYQLSALQILGMMVRLKIPGVAESVFQQYLDLALDFLANSPTDLVKVGTLELIEVFLLVFPKAIQGKLSELRDGVRLLLVEKNKEIARAAVRVYPLIFRAVTKHNALEFEQYLQSETRTIRGLSGLQAAADPFISHLSKDDTALILNLSVLSMGMILDTPTSAYQVAQSILKFVAQPNPELRLSALTAIFSLFQTMDPVESSATMWILLPLYADPYKGMRDQFGRFLKNIPNQVEARCLSVSPHLDDQPNLSLTSWEEILTDTASITVTAKNLMDLMSPIDVLAAQAEGNGTLDDEVFHHPIISEKLMKKFKILAHSAGASVTAATQAEVTYYLNEIGKLPFLKPYVLLVLSEFAVAHTQNIAEVGDLLLTCASQDLSVSNYYIVEAALLGLRNIADSAPESFKSIITRLVSAQIPNEGEFLAMLYLAETIRDQAAKRIPELLSRYTPIISSPRHPLRRRIYCAYLMVELASFSGSEEATSVVDSLQTLLDTIQNPKMLQSLFRAAGKLLNIVGVKHPLFKKILSNTARDVRGRDAGKRVEALALFRVVANFLNHEERVWYMLYFLADSSPEVRRTAQEAFIQDKLLEFAYPSLRRDGGNLSKKAVSIFSNHLASLQQMGIVANGSDLKEETVVVPDRGDEDPYNINYYNSERRKKFTNMYGLPEANFAKAVTSLSEGVIKGIEKYVTKTPIDSPDAASKHRWILEIDPLAILKALIELQTNTADDIINTLFTEVEAGTNTNQADGTPLPEEYLDISLMSHRIDVLSNLLVAHDGIGDRTVLFSWISRIKALIQKCLTSSESLRENLYNDLERSLYFFNEHAVASDEVPIVSDEAFERLEKMKHSRVDAVLEIVKGGRTDQYNAYEASRTEYNASMGAANEQLYRLNTLALHMFSGFGVFNAISNSIAPLTLMEELKFMIDLLQNEHRGIRIAAVDGFLTTTKYRNEEYPSQDLSDYIFSTVNTLIKRLSEEYGTLYRRKADIIRLISQLSLVVTDHNARLAIVQAIIKSWRDPDSEVRKNAIQMILFMGEQNVSEVSDSFAGHDTHSVPDRVHEVSENKTQYSDANSIGMKELVALMNMEEYPEKELLQELLRWRFNDSSNKDADNVISNRSSIAIH